jgi:hypothetical protein
MSRAWFALAVAGVLGLFYAGAGLHDAGTSAGGLAYGQEAAGQMPTLVWERLKVSGVDTSTAPRVYRCKIHGGWLLETSRSRGSFGGQSGGGIGVGLTFIPDPEHKWDGNSLP